ncbi:MAG TPA: hypothetical protein DIU00_01530 [Phycisphaerales bacterium]|nr:hypothetical protein [Phycisphaerales bacterium]
MKRPYGPKITIVLIIALLVGLTPDITNAQVVVCVGASITAGHSLSAEDSYPAQLQRVLREYDGGWETQNFGVSATVVIRNAPLTAYINTNACKLALASGPDVVVIQLGGNDSLPGMWARKASFVSDFIALIDAFAELPSQPLIFIWLPTPIFSSPYGHNNNVVKNEIIPLMQQLPEQRQVHLIDLYTPFKDKAHLFPDGIHPNAEGAGLIAEIVAAAIVDLRMPPDFNGDGLVDADDMCIMIENWGTDSQQCDIAPPPFGDSVVDVNDLILLAEHLFEVSPSAETVDVNEADNSGQIELELGKLLVVTLESNPSTGYRWDLAENNQSALKQFGQPEYKPSENSGPRTVGAGGWEIFRFKAINAGQSTLKLVYHRSWEDVEPLKTFSIQVTVN